MSNPWVCLQPAGLTGREQGSAGRRGVAGLTMAGLRGEPFPSPFATPHGVGNSRPVVDVLWGVLNVVAGVSLLAYAPVAVGFNLPFISAVVGARWRSSLEMAALQELAHHRRARGSPVPLLKRVKGHFTSPRHLIAGPANLASTLTPGAPAGGVRGCSGGQFFLVGSNSLLNVPEHEGCV